MAEIETDRKHKIKNLIAERDHPGGGRPKKGAELPCFWCGRSFPISGRPRSSKVLTLDRLIPKSLGGTNAQANLVLACRSCNNRRNHFDPKVMAKAVSKLEQNLRRPEYLGTHHAHREIDMAHYFRSKLDEAEGCAHHPDPCNFCLTAGTGSLCPHKSGTGTQENEPQSG